MEVCKLFLPQFRRSGTLSPLLASTAMNLSGWNQAAPSLETILRDELIDSLRMTLSLEGLAHHALLLNRLNLLEPIALSRHNAIEALKDREDWPGDGPADRPDRLAADAFMDALCGAADDGDERDPAFPARDQLDDLHADILHLAHVVKNQLAEMKRTAAANARSRHVSNRTNLASSSTPGQGLNDSTAKERQERRLRALIDARIEHIHAYGGLSFEPIRREDQADLETTKAIWEASAGPCPILPEYDSLRPGWATTKAEILERNKQNAYCGKYEAFPNQGMPPPALQLIELRCVMRGASVAWTFGPESKDANGEIIRPHVTFTDLDRVGYGVKPNTYVQCAVRWSLIEQLVDDITKRCLTRGSSARQTYELIRRIYSDLSSRLTNGGKVITLTHAVISLRTQRGEGLFDLNSQPGYLSNPRTRNSSTPRTGKSPSRAGRDSRSRTVAEPRRKQFRSTSDGKRVRFNAHTDDEASGPESRGASPERSRAGPSSDSGSRGVCYAWRDHGRCNRGSDCRFEHTPSEKGANQRAA